MSFDVKLYGGAVGDAGSGRCKRARLSLRLRCGAKLALQRQGDTMKRLLLLLLLAYPLAAQEIVTQPASQTVLVGQNATFTVASTSACRSLWFINGHGKYGPFGPSYVLTIPLVNLAQSGTTIQIELYNCPDGTPSVWSAKAVLTVVAIPPNIPLTISGSMLFDDGTVVYVGPILLEQFDGVNWVQAGSAASDATGTLSGTLIINPNLVDADNYITLRYTIPGTTAPIASVENAMPVDEFQQGAASLTAKVVLYKAVFLKKLLAVTKSSTVSLQ